MKREILCAECSEKHRLHPADVALGFKMRRDNIASVKVPAGHGIKINGVSHPMAAIKCDHCDVIIEDGKSATAFTCWNGHREDEPFHWEKEYSSGP